MQFRIISRKTGSAYRVLKIGVVRERWVNRAFVLFLWISLHNSIFYEVKLGDA
jgi:hypothetical protein